MYEKNSKNSWLYYQHLEWLNECFCLSKTSLIFGQNLNTNQETKAGHYKLLKNISMVCIFLKKNYVEEVTVCVFLHENLSFKLREDLSINCDVIQSLSIEISSTKSKNIILNTIYRPPNGDMKRCETHFEDLFSKKWQKSEKYSTCRRFQH